MTDRSTGSSGRIAGDETGAAPHRWRRRAIRWAPAAIGVLTVALVVLFTAKHAPGPLRIRAALDAESARVTAAMDAYTAPGIAVTANVRYGSAPAERLDVYTRHGTRRAQPTVVWTHGGAWIAGSKREAAPYFTQLAAHGYTVVSLGYSLAPEHHYPTPVRQVNRALAFLQRRAPALHVDPDRIVLAGDSAGAQITSQVAALTTNPAYAAAMRIRPALDGRALRGVVLDCGIYDALPFLDRGRFSNVSMRFGIATVMWAYTDSTHREPAGELRQMSTIDHVTPAFPPAFISGGNDDPLTDRQSRPMAAKLRRLGVPVDTVFFPADHTPPLRHEYQFALDTPAGQMTLRRTIAFLDARTR